MKIHFALLLPLALCCLAGRVHAGSAVATDHHGGFGYAYGEEPETVLRREARARCREQSRHAEQVDVVVSTTARGVGVVVRYQVAGRQHVYAYVGAGSFEEARQRAEAGARERGGDHPEVVARWED